MLNILQLSRSDRRLAPGPTKIVREIELDVTRGVAIFLAMGWHFNDLSTGIPPIDWLLAPGRLFGWAGVDLFFVLSGFLVGRLIFNEYQRTGTFHARRFLVRRALKIWPILYFFLVCQLLVGFKPWETYLPQIFFHVQNFWKTPILHLWSLAVEEHFYLIFAFCFTWFAASRSKHPARIIHFIIPVLLVPPLLRALAVWLSVDPLDIQWQTQYRADALSLGVILAALAVFKKAEFEKLLNYRWLYLAVVIGGCTILGFSTLYSEFSSVFGFTIAYLTAGAFLLLSYKNPVILRFPAVFTPLATIGVYSYAMYIWHPGMVRVSEYAVRYISGMPYENLILLLIRYGGAILIAAVVTKLIERPFLALRDYIFPRSDEKAIGLSLQKSG